MGASHPRCAKLVQGLIQALNPTQIRCKKCDLLALFQARNLSGYSHWRSMTAEP